MDLNHARLPIPPLRHNFLSLPNAVSDVKYQPVHTIWKLQRPEPEAQAKTMSEGQGIPPGHAAEVRRLVHDLSNALEIIVQTQYLLRMGQADETTLQWLAMMDNGVRQATEVSRNLRTYVSEHTAPQ